MTFSAKHTAQTSHSTNNDLVSTYVEGRWVWLHASPAVWELLFSHFTDEVG